MSLPFVRVPHDREDDVLVAKRFPRSPGLSKFVRRGNIVLLLFQLATPLLYRDICSVAVVAAICMLRSFVGNHVVVRVATVGGVIVRLGIVFSITIVIVVGFVTQIR